MHHKQDRWNKFIGEGFLRLVFYRGFLQFGILGGGLFLFFSAIRGDPQFELHAIRALIGFPVLGLVVGASMWLIGKMLGKCGNP